MLIVFKLRVYAILSQMQIVSLFTLFEDRVVPRDMAMCNRTDLKSALSLNTLKKVEKNDQARNNK